MANNPIKVILDVNTSIDIDSNTPDIDGLLLKITQLRTSINPDAINLTCEDKNFDIEGFKTILVKVTKDYLKAIKLEEDKLASAISKIKA